MATAMFACPICGRDYDLVDGDNPLGTASLNVHFDEVGCNDPLTFEVAREESPPAEAEQ